MTPIEYNPVQSLREEVERFKQTNVFSPLLVTHFYAQSSVVLAYVRELEDALDDIVKAIELYNDPSANALCRHSAYALLLREARRHKTTRSWHQNDKEEPK